MKVEDLTLRQYRNYGDVSVDFNPSLNILVGNNAQGKTNLAEALYFLALGRSHRTYQDNELIRWERDWASLSASIQSETGHVRLDARIPLGKRKSFRISGNEIKSLSELYGYFNVVLFSPDDLQLVKSSPSLRRQFLDVVLAQVSKVYRSYLVEYTRILQQRNSTLKLLSERRCGPEMLDVWNPQLIETGSRIMLARYNAIESLSGFASAIHGEMTGGKEALSMSYQPFFSRKSNSDEDCTISMQTYEDMQTRFAADLERRRSDELRRGITLVGPQRDDVAFSINGYDARTFGSQGQQRTVVLSCKLAEAEYMKHETGEYPVLLLDDVMSELDYSRRQFFLEAIKKKIQIILTTTSLSSFTKEMLQEAAVFAVESGSINEIGPDGYEV